MNQATINGAIQAQSGLRDTNRTALHALGFTPEGIKSTLERGVLPSIDPMVWGLHAGWVASSAAVMALRASR